MRRSAALLLFAFLAQLLLPAPAAVAAKPSISIKDSARDEPLVDGMHPFTLKLSAPSSRKVMVSWTTTSGSATAGQDYAASSGLVTFKAGVTRQKIFITVWNDGIDEDDETFGIALSNPVRSKIADGDAVGIIRDIDPPPQVSIGNVSALEGNSGSKDVNMIISLTEESTRQVTVTLTVTSGGGDPSADPATEGVDFSSSAAGQITFTPGQTTKQATFTIIGDTDFEKDEEWIATLSDPVNATLGDASGFGLIINDDPT